MSLFEHILTWKGYPLQEAKKEIARIHAMGADERRAWQQHKAWDIARFHYRNNAMYARKVGGAFPSRWEDLPVITKKDLQQPLEQLITKGIKLKNCHTGSTSGSTGTPFFYTKDKFTHAMTWVVIADRYNWYDLSTSSKQARFYGIPKEPVAYLQEQLKDRIMNRRRFPVFDLSDTALEKFLNRFRKQRFDYIYGYTSSLVMFARYLAANDIVLKDEAPHINVCISTSEMATPEDHALLEKSFGVPHVREYGLSETCITAFDHPEGYWQLTDETLLTEVLENDNSVSFPGAEGRIITTSLYNKVLPMIRYDTGDAGVITIKDGRRALNKLTGRTNDVVILPGGKKAAGLTFYYVSRSVLETSGVLKEFIIRQTQPDHFIFDIVSERELTDTEKELVKEKISLYLGQHLHVTFNRVEKIERPASGKLKHFYSELDLV